MDNLWMPNLLIYAHVVHLNARVIYPTEKRSQSLMPKSITGYHTVMILYWHFVHLMSLQLGSMMKAGHSKMEKKLVQLTAGGLKITSFWTVYKTDQYLRHL